MYGRFVPSAFYLENHITRQRLREVTAEMGRIGDQILGQPPGTTGKGTAPVFALWYVLFSIFLYFV